jgi:predicted small secreted protein
MPNGSQIHPYYSLSRVAKERQPTHGSKIPVRGFYLDLSKSKLLSYQDLITITEEALDVDFEFVNQALTPEFRDQANQGSAQE